MPKEEWGTKRVCPTTGKRFYDMNRSPIVSPYTGETVVIDTSRTGRMMVADKPDRDAKKDVVEDDEVVLDDEDVDIDDDSDDEVLEDDNDDDDVSLDDIADVSDEGDDES
ncbi:TIGR02300 family protein [Roseitranquillus sediminis]|uniref:TIGR02300 family protein n=1 Tax=Roseitranquillus sediminis TaxID=2809051 RepID=UPI001D0CDB68|nr:TIGR02300 family protein [Roseitranquillus sediminis]MBM9594941.1 TIGR02300 family protein [Roseitranquillus sediminis]